MVGRTYSLKSTPNDRFFWEIYDDGLRIYIHTYIIGRYNPSVRIIDLVSHTARDLQLKVNAKRQIFFEKFMTTVCVFTYIHT